MPVGFRHRHTLFAGECGRCEREAAKVFSKDTEGDWRVNDASLTELCFMSRALERAIRAIPDKPRPDIETAHLVEGVLAAVREGVRDETEIAERALERVGVLASKRASEAAYD